MVKAAALLTGTQHANGTVTFSQEGTGPVTTVVTLSQFSTGLYQLAVQSLGDITNGSDSAGTLFKDLGGVTVGADGSLNYTFYSDKITISPSDPNSIIGRAFVVHAGGSAGPAVVWGVIGRAA